MDKFVYLFMRKVIFFVLSFFSLMSSCIKKDDSGVVRTYTYTPPSIPIVIPDTSTIPGRSYLALGDSYTIGQSVPVADRFPVLTAKFLTAEGIKFGEPEIIAQTGWTTGSLISAISISPPTKPAYDIVTLLIGVNNQYQRRTREEYANEFLLLLNKSIVYAGNNKKRVIVLSIPDYSVTQFASGSDKVFIASEIDAFNVINKKITEQAGITYLNITGASRLAAFDPSLIAGDGLHPSGQQYKLWTDLLVPAIRKALL